MLGGVSSCVYIYIYIYIYIYMCVCMCVWVCMCSLKRTPDIGEMLSLLCVWVLSSVQRLILVSGIHEVVP